MLWLLLSLMAAFATPPTHSADRPVSISTVADATDVEDPRALYRAAQHWLDAGNLVLAEQLVRLALEREEYQRYLRVRPSVEQALVHERLQQHDQATALWRQGFTEDIQSTLLALRIVSHHPERDALVTEGIADLRDRVARAKAGEQVEIYRTKKGSPRYLDVIPDDDVADRVKAAPNGKLQYCYIDTLDYSRAATPELPAETLLSRCIIGELRIPDRDVTSFKLRGIVLGDMVLGKDWEGEVNKSTATPGSRFEDLMIRESIVLGEARLQDVTVSGRNAYFAISSFEGHADFRDTRFEGVADLRFSVFGGGANFKGSHMADAVYFGGSRYLADTTFRGMFSEQDVFFNSARFEKAVAFDRCEWTRGATFENSTFNGPVSFNSSQLGGRLNLSRAVFEDTLTMKEMHLGGMDLIGAWLKGPAAFVDVQFDGKVRFSLDDITRAAYLADPTPLLTLYRDYQGDKDADEPLTRHNSYGVEHVDDLIARVDHDISFANSVFSSFTIFERVQFGTTARKALASFYNTQFGGETHFERTTWHADADFTTIFADELSLNEANFHHALVLDDANVSGRVTLTDATFAPGANLSFYGAQLAAFQIDQDQIVRDDGSHRLYYGQCTEEPESAGADMRAQRISETDPDALSQICQDRLIDEYVGLKESFGDRAMTADEDWAYWWIKHTELMRDLRFGDVPTIIWSAIAWPIFELAFGWGVRLSNLGGTVLFITLLFAWIYRVWCPETVVVYNGDDIKIRDVPFHGLIYISLQSLGAFNTGWDFGEDDARFQYLNTLETFLGIIIMTFFVGAYTRLILA